MQQNDPDSKILTIVISCTQLLLVTSQGGSPLIVRVNVEQAVNAGGEEEAESQGTADDYHASQVTLPFVFVFNNIAW